MLGGNEEFAGERRFGGAAVESFFSGKPREIGIVVFLGDVSEDEIAGVGIKAFRVREEFADGVIGKMAGTRKDALLDDPGIRANLEHIEIVIGFENEAVGLAKMDFHEFRHVAKVSADGDFGAVGAKGEADGIRRVVRNRKGVDVDITNGETLAGLDGFHATEALAESVRQNALQRAHSRFGNVKRRFPETENLGKPVAVIGVFVGDENGIDAIDIALDGGEAGERFAFTKAGVYEDTGAFGFEQGEIARATRRKNRDAQADGRPPTVKEKSKKLQK